MLYLEKIINKLTCDGNYANSICLELMLYEKYETLNYLDYLDIKGKDLEILADKCCDQSDINYFTQTVRFLRSGFLSNKEIFDNLHSNNPVFFIDRLIENGEDWEHVYEDYAYKFYKNFKANNNSR